MFLRATLNYVGVLLFSSDSHGIHLLSTWLQIFCGALLRSVSSSCASYISLTFTVHSFETLTTSANKCPIRFSTYSTVSTRIRMTMVLVWLKNEQHFRSSTNETKVLKCYHDGHFAAHYLAIYTYLYRSLFISTRVKHWLQFNQLIPLVTCFSLSNVRTFYSSMWEVPDH